MRNQVHLWCTFSNQAQDQYLLAEYLRLMSESERERMAGFRFEHDRHTYLVTRALVRTVLSRYAAIAPESWSFSVNAYGKPAISPHQRCAEGLVFNVTHTHDLIIMAVAYESALGVDAEYVGTRPAPFDIADRFFSKHELMALRALPAHLRSARFFQIWTLKEAYIKARGMGLSIPLDQFTFDFAHGMTPAISMRETLNDTPLRWRFWQGKPIIDYVLAVCVENTAPGDLRLTVNTIVPLCGEQLLLSTLVPVPAINATAA